MKVRSLEELGDKLDQDLGWRKKEFTTLKFMIADARDHERLILLRASIALFYSHWEGHVKHCALVYLTYLNHRAPKYSEMTENFFQISLGEKFRSGFSIKRYDSQKELFTYLEKEKNKKFNVREEAIIDTESNLKSEVVFRMLGQLGLDMKPFELKENFIDAKMLKCRNAIAHGDRINRKELDETYDELEKELLGMIQTFHNMVKTAAENENFLK